MIKNTISIQLETLTPVHIGSGEQLQGNFEYLYFPDENVIGVIDSNKVMEIINKDNTDQKTITENINRWVESIDNQRSILDAIPELRKVASKALSKRIIEIYDKVPNPDKNTIKEQLHLGNQQPTIPGSSLKGAIRTAILTKLIKEKSSFANDSKNIKNYKGQFSDSSIITEYLAKEVRTDRRTGRKTSKYSANKDVFRFLRVGDFYFDAETTVVKNTVINLFNNGWGEKKQESAYWECIPQGTITNGTIQTPKDLIEQVQKKGYLTQNDFNFNLFKIEQLFKLINKHTKDLVEKELLFWEDEDNPLAIGDYVKHLKNIENTIKNCGEDSCVIRVGASNGWKFITGGWASSTDIYDDYILEEQTWNDLKKQLRRGRYPNNIPFPKTRKMIDGGMPIGFVKLNVI